jgi:hypothetical protein|tara:strand:+ start:4953 stop:5120 length:168 start_codon:yes stop_codon:yes gene_type:complete
MSTNRTNRSEEIVRGVDVHHMTLTAVAKLYSISKQRAKQIYDKTKRAQKEAQADV